MRKYFLLCLAVFVCPLFAFPQAPRQDTTPYAHYRGSRLEFTATPTKTSYLPLEPLAIRFELKNPTTLPFVTRLSPDFLFDSTATIADDTGKETEIRGLTNSSGSGLNLPNSRFEIGAGKSYDETSGTVLPLTDFSKPGNYTLQITFNGLVSKKTSITVVELNERDKAAYDFICAHGKDVWFTTLVMKKGGGHLLRSFVQLYSDTGYGPYGIYALGNYYLYWEKDKSRAKAEFEKITSGPNEHLADLASRKLKDLK